MKNSVYVVGMKIPGSGSPEEAVSILRSNEYFGQYGKIARLYLRDRSIISSPSPGPSPDSPATSTGIYIVYIRREDAARAIAALDGIPAPQGPPGHLLRASYGTTRYCDAFLRGAKCDNQGCQSLHEWGGEGDVFSRSDLITALTRPAEYDAKQKQQQIQPPPLTQKSAWPKPSADDADSSNALPRTASWGMRPSPARPGSANGGRIAPVGSSRPTSSKINSNLIPLGGRGSSAFPPPTPSSIPTVHSKLDKKKEKAQGMSRARSGSSSMSSGPGLASATASPKKKAVTITMTQSAIIAPPKSSTLASTSTPTSASASASASAPVASPAPPAAAAPAPAAPATAPTPPPGLAPPPGLTPPPTVAAKSSDSAAEDNSEPEPEPMPRKVLSPVKVRSASLREPEEEPEAGPSRQTSPAKRPASTEYPIHSPYPDFDDVFMEPDARKQGFEFSLGLDDDELQRLLQFAQEMGAFEPSPFDPLLEELPKLGIPLASLIAVPRAAEVNGPIVYTGPFSPFTPSSTVETSSLPTSDEPSAATSASSDADAPRTTSRFEFARRGSLASAGRGQSPFRAAREEWNGVPGAAHRAPSSNGYADEVPRHFHPALAHLNSHAHSHSHSHSHAQQHHAQGSGDQWSATGSDYAGPSYSSRVPYQHSGQHHNYGGNAAYDSPQREPMYSPASHVHPGYDYVSQHQQQGPPQSPMYAGGFMQRRF